MNKKNKKSITICAIVTILLTILLGYDFVTMKGYTSPYNKYRIYLDGEKIGLIDSKDELYSMINKEQTEIKEKYKVSKVYPPKGFEIIKVNTYDTKNSSISEVYEKIKSLKEFTVKGYNVIIKSNDTKKAPIYINVLNKEIFKEALERYVRTFIGEDRYKQYLDESQPEIIDTGFIIENMYFQERITVKDAYISVDEKIYTDVDELTKYLLYGDNTEKKEYTVVQGDTVESVAFANKLSASELIIANDDIKSTEALLAIGQTVNVSYIAPKITLIYEELVTQDSEQQYQTVIQEDSSQYTSYKAVKQKGENGINRITSRVQFINGTQNEGVTFVGDPVVIKPVVNEVVVKGTKKYYAPQPDPTIGGGGDVIDIRGQQVDNGATWGWPTNTPYMITSPYGYRWGTLHDGIDISGTGYGSPIYASLDGTVVQAQWGGMVGNSAGINVVLAHDNGYYTVYAHLSKFYVSPGQRVSRGERIGAMGHTGNAFGTHLHFGVFTGPPYNGGRSFNPLRLWQ